METVVGFVYLLLLLVTVFSLQTQCISVCCFTFSPVLLVWLCRGYSVLKSRCWVFIANISLKNLFWDILKVTPLDIRILREQKSGFKNFGLFVNDCFCRCVDTISSGSIFLKLSQKQNECTNSYFKNIQKSTRDSVNNLNNVQKL